LFVNILIFRFMKRKYKTSEKIWIALAKINLEGYIYTAVEFVYTGNYVDGIRLVQNINT